MPDLQIQQIREVGLAAVILAFTAGFVDAVGYIVLFKIFTAYTSGNTVAMCVLFSRYDPTELFRRALPILMFILGTGVGAFLNQALPRLGLRSTFSILYGLEILLLTSFIFIDQPVLGTGEKIIEFDGRYYAALALLPVAMGLQNSTVRRIGGGTVHTTYITGLLTSLMHEIVNCLFNRYDAWRDRVQSTSIAPSSLYRIALMSGVYLGFPAGALTGGFAERAWALASLLIPVCCLSGLILFDLRYEPFETTA